MTNIMYDFIIVGGGPAGSTLARLINKTFKVLILEKSGENNQEKLCGGLISPDAQKMLAKFDLTLPNNILVNPQMFYAKAIDLNTNRSQKYQRFYLNTNRKKFDNWLLSLSKVEIMRNSKYISHEILSDKIIVKIESNGIVNELTTGRLIGADGAKSMIRRNIYNDFSRINKYVSIQSEVQSNENPSCFKVFFDNTITDYYGWAIPKKNSTLVGIALKGKNSKQQYERFLAKIFESSFKENNRQSTIIIRPKKPSDFKTAYKNRIFLVGEAAGFISPSSAEGISYAFKSAKALADSINKNENIQISYTIKLIIIKFELYFKWIKVLVMFNQTLRNLVFRLGINKL